jgi:polyisoprenoid-binding protein YceI
MKRLNFRPLVLAAALGLGMLGSAGAAEYTTLDSKASNVTFSYSQMSVDMDGKFGELQATALSFDPAHPENAKVTIEIATTKIDAGYAEANSELAKDEWLALNAHPLATFTSTKIEALGDNRYQAIGDLSIKGTTKQVTAPFTFKEEGNKGVFEGSFTFQRADFGVGQGQWKDFGIVANDIKIGFRIIANS